MIILEFRQGTVLPDLPRSQEDNIQNSYLGKKRRSPQIPQALEPTIPRTHNPSDPSPPLDLTTRSVPPLMYPFLLFLPSFPALPHPTLHYRSWLFPGLMSASPFSVHPANSISYTSLVKPN